MSEAQEQQQKPGTDKAEPPKVVDPPKQEPPKAEAKPPKQEPPKAEAKGGDKDPKRVRVGADDEEIPDEVDLVELTPRALQSRLVRASKRQLREHFGTDDVEQIKKDLAEAKSLREEKEKGRRDRMEETDRLKEDLAKLKAERDDARGKLRTERLSSGIERVDAQIARVAEKHVDPEYADVVMARFARHLTAEHSDKQIEELQGSAAKLEKAAEKFFAEYVEKHPKLARDPGDAAGGKDPPKVPLTNGADARNRPAPQGTPPGEKTYAPGRQNSMSREEARAQAAKEGFHW